MSQANKEGLEQQLSEKIQILHQLHEEALELEKQMEKQKREIGKKQKELEDLQGSVASVNPEDPRHVSKTCPLRLFRELRILLLFINFFSCYLKNIQLLTT